MAQFATSDLAAALYTVVYHRIGEGVRSILDLIVAFSHVGLLSRECLCFGRHMLCEVGRGLDCLFALR